MNVQDIKSNDVQRKILKQMLYVIMKHTYDGNPMSYRNFISYVRCYLHYKSRDERCVFWNSYAGVADFAESLRKDKLVAFDLKHYPGSMVDCKITIQLKGVWLYKLLYKKSS